MIALDDYGNIIISNANFTRAFNKLMLIKLVHSMRSELSQNNIELIKKKTLEAYGLAERSCNAAFIAGTGLKAFVANEETDAQNHHVLTSISDALYEQVYVKLFPLAEHIQQYSGENVIGFQKYCLIKTLNEILSEICKTN